MTSALMATQVFDKGAGEYGILGSTMAIGSLAGALIAARRVGKPRQRLLILSGLAFGVVEILSGLMPSYLWFAVLTPLLGLTVLTMVTAANATVQLSVTPVMRGRVMALYMMIFQGGTPVGAPIVGWVGDTFGARWTLIGGGAMTVAGIVAAVAVYSLYTGVRRLVVQRPVEDDGRVEDRPRVESPQPAGSAHSVESPRPVERPRPDRLLQRRDAAGEVVAGRA